jgi:hypothetical protein
LEWHDATQELEAIMSDKEAIDKIQASNQEVKSEKEEFPTMKKLYNPVDPKPPQTSPDYRTTCSG